MPRLDDPWFNARFISNVAPDGRSYQYHGALAGAQGLMFWCPCGYGRPEYPLHQQSGWPGVSGPVALLAVSRQPGPRPHAVQMPFANPVGGAPPPPAAFGPGSAANPGGPRPRWQVVGGTGLGDLSLSPSNDVRGGAGGASCWHGHITAGEVTGCPVATHPPDRAGGAP